MPSACVHVPRVCAGVGVPVCMPVAWRHSHPEVGACSWLQPEAEVGKAHAAHGAGKRGHDKAWEGSVIKTMKPAHIEFPERAELR